MDKKTRDRANCKGQLALTMRGERLSRRIVRSQRSQTLAQTTTQLNDGTNLTDSKKTVTDWGAEDWKRVSRSDESRFRLFSVDGRLRIWRQAHEAMDNAC
ncbi:HTH_Tnp_Tc3_2 domain-containing protein [Trichonephila clavipes]|nr:HTH_Tnp_Tc3_2 domain-containing protein [Trichonephila clavipes]